MTTGVRSVEVPAFALAALTEREGVGEPHLVLREPAVWLPPAEQEERARAALAGAGVFAEPGQVDRHLLDLLPLLTAPAFEYSGWFTEGGRTKGVLAAAGELDGVVAVRDDDLVRITPTSPERLAEAFTSALPDVPSGRGPALTVTGADIEDLRAPADVNARQVPAHVIRLVRLARGAVHDGGELYTATRDALGRCTTRGPVWYADTDDGRYLNYAVGAGDALRIVVAPATGTALVEALRHAGTQTSGRTTHASDRLR